MKKNRTIFSFVATLCASAACTMTLQSCQSQYATPTLSPAPQEIAWGEETFNTPKSIVLVGADEADADAVALLRGAFAEGRGLSVIVGERGDEAVSAYAEQIPDKVEGYYISVAKNQVVIAGNDEAGTYYGVQTFLQMVSQPEVMTAEVKDWPDVLERGVVEVAPLAYMRGRTLSDSFIILDEAQNYTVAELKKVLTRCHDTCKVIVIGHTGQIDIRGGSGFARYLEHFDGQERCAVCRLTTNHRGWLSTFADMLEG